VLKDHIKTVYEETLKCIRCGFCEIHCPTLLETDYNRLYGPRGRVQIVKGILEGEFKPTIYTLKTMYTCLLCNACYVACPAGVDVQFIIRTFRTLLRSGVVKGLKF